MESVSVKGAVLSALALGPAGAPPVAMLHGLVWGSMASFYAPVASALAASFRVILYDQRGHGGSSAARAGYDLDSQANDLAAVLAHFGLAETPVHLVGHSMGALIALRFALRHPARLRRLVLLDAPMPASAHVAPSLRACATASDIERLIDAQVQGRRRARLRQRLGALLCESSLVADISGMGNEPESALAAYTGAVLLIYGRTSPCLAACASLRRALRHVEYDVLEAGHYLLEEAPEPVCAHLMRFLLAAEAA
jgi:pimeloyl-ACP methyl ester carboxylesterase